MAENKGHDPMPMAEAYVFSKAYAAHVQRGMFAMEARQHAEETVRGFRRLMSK